jgi:hypothetical protein
MKIKERALKVWHYLVARSGEMSSKRGLVQLLGGVSWAALDTSSKGELLAASAMILLGAVQILTPNEKLYGPNP